ncbi:MAG: DUF58 domain-containing protein [Myxococcales bacterium]|nr:DUF58 domain-containing protein [Myxococcales bacterium]MCB9522626.1 DUF58 domain-containing protein [Myxococcales bacterium]
MTSAAEKLVDPKLLARLAGLGVKVRQAMEGVLTGQHKSPHHGSSVEFAQHREYAPGDEIKHIDWKAYAKSDRFHIKQFEDETNLRTYLCVDTSGSMGYRGARGTESKGRYAAQMAAVLAWLLLRQGDAVGLLTFGERLGAYVPPRARPDHYWHLARTLVDTPVGGQTDAVGALERVAEVAARRSLVVLLTDGFDFNSPGRMAAVARQLRRRNHRVVVFQILDPDEVDFPFKDLTVFEDMEVADDRALADPRGMREAYLDEIRAYCDGLKRDLLEGDVGYRRVVTSTPLDRTIIDALGGRA